MDKISFFDFDRTLVRISKDDLDNYNKKYFDKPESLLDNKWTLNEDIIDIYKDRKSDPRVLVALLTNRIYTLSDIIKNRLEKEGITFDEYLFRRAPRNGNLSSKSGRVMELLEKKPDIKKVEIWDDKPKHIVDIKTIVMNNMELDEFKINNVDGTNVINYEVNGTDK